MRFQLAHIRCATLISIRYLLFSRFWTYLRRLFGRLWVVWLMVSCMLLSIVTCTRIGVNRSNQFGLNDEKMCLNWLISFEFGCRAPAIEWNIDILDEVFSVFPTHQLELVWTYDSKIVLVVSTLSGSYDVSVDFMASHPNFLRFKTLAFVIAFSIFLFFQVTWEEKAFLNGFLCQKPLLVNIVWYMMTDLLGTQMSLDIECVNIKLTSSPKKQQQICLNHRHQDFRHYTYKIFPH